MMKKFVFGLILGMGLMLAVNVQAEVTSLIGKTIEGQFPVKVDGETIASPGIVVEGTSYLPTRTIAELAGFDVAFDADMGVELTKQEEVASISSEVMVVEPANTVQDNPVDVENRLEALNQSIQMKQEAISATEWLLSLVTDESKKAEIQADLTKLYDELNAMNTEKAQLSGTSE